MKELDKEKKGNKKSRSKKNGEKTIQELIKESLVTEEKIEQAVILKGQYKEALQLLADADAAGLTPMLVGPPGVGKTLLSRYYAIQTRRHFEWMTFDESTKPVHFIGAFDPALTLQKGFTLESFLPGPLTIAMVHGGIFLANEVNRASEYTQNSLLEPLEERSLYIPRIGRIKAKDDFFFIAAGNPRELAGTHRMSEAVRDRITVWISLQYPDKKTEIEILKASVPEASLSSDVYEAIHQLVAVTRNWDIVEVPASLRTGIAMLKLAAQKKDGLEKDFTNTIRSIARTVLSGSIKIRPGMDQSVVINQIVDSALSSPTS